MFIDRTQLDTQAHAAGLLWTGDRLVTEAATYTTHNKHNKPISIPSVEFEPAIPTNERLQTYSLDRTATWIERKI